MEHGYASMHEIEKLCKTDIRFMWLLQDSPSPTFMTTGNFINDCLLGNIDDILVEINSYIFAQKIRLPSMYIYTEQNSMYSIKNNVANDCTKRLTQLDF